MTAVTTGRRTVAVVALVVGAVFVELHSLPAVVRSLLAFPVFVLVSGHSLTRLVLDGRHPERGTGRDRVDRELDGLLRVVLPVLLGMLVLLAAVLLLSVLGIAIGTRSAAVATGGAAVGLVVLAQPSRTGLRTWPPRARPRRAPLTLATAVAAAAMVIGVAVAGAVTLRPVPVVPYTQIGIDDPGVVAGSSVSAAPGAPVVLRWTLRGYGRELPAAPAVDVTVAGRVVPLTEVEAVAAAPTQDGVNVEHGAVGFAAPTQTGLYDLRIRVGTETPTPSVLVVRLQVGGA